MCGYLHITEGVCVVSLRRSLTERVCGYQRIVGVLYRGVTGCVCLPGGRVILGVWARAGQGLGVGRAGWIETG